MPTNYLKNERLWPEPAYCLWKSCPSDFQVEELWTPVKEGEYSPGNAEHSLLKVRKVGQNTQWVARQIARYAGVRDMDVGFHGLKDRHAVTTQWFSVYSGGRKIPDWDALDIPEVAILRAGKTPRKLRRGEHQGNRFHISLRQVKGDRQAIFNKLDAIKRAGFPNYFGPQRFGRNGSNLCRADDWFSKGSKPGSQSAKGLLLSAARALLFNKILEQRLQAGSWSQLISGDQVIEYTTSAGRQQKSPSGPLLGGAEFLQGDAGEIESRTVAKFAPWLQGLHEAGSRTTRRAFVAVAENLVVDTQEEDIILCFDLAPGSYASVMLDQVFDLQAGVSRQQ